MAYYGNNRMPARMRYLRWAALFVAQNGKPEVVPPAKGNEKPEVVPPAKGDRFEGIRPMEDRR